MTFPCVAHPGTAIVRRVIHTRRRDRCPAKECTRSDFDALLTTRGGAQASLVAFDLLRLDGEDLRLRPIEARREALTRLVAGAKGVVFSDALAAEGAVGFAKACELQEREKPPTTYTVVRRLNSSENLCSESVSPICRDPVADP